MHFIRNTRRCPSSRNVYYFAFLELASRESVVKLATRHEFSRKKVSIEIVAAPFELVGEARQL